MYNNDGFGRALRGLAGIACLLTLAGLASCAKVDKPWTTQEFYFNCWSDSGRVRCNYQAACNTLRSGLESDPANLQECLTICAGAANLRADDGALDGCDEGVINIERTCEQYCRRKFP